MEVSFYLKSPTATEPTSLYARICYFGIKMKYYPSIQIHPKFWNKEAQKARQKLEGYANFNRRLDDIARDAQNALTEFQNNNNGSIPTIKQIRELIDLKLKDVPESKTQITFVEFFKKFVTESGSGLRLNVSSKKPLSASTVQTYISTQKVFDDYISFTRKKLDFENIDLDFYQSFTTYLQKTKKQSVNSIGKHIKILKTVLNEATEAGVNKNTSFKSKRFIKVSEDSENIYLTESEINEIAKKDLTDKPHLERVRDLFVIGCYTGLRFSDFSILKKEQIKDGYIETTQIKTDQPIVIPIHDEVKKIIAKYNGSLPASVSNQKTNEHLRDITKDIESLQVPVPITFTKAGNKVTKSFEKWELVTTHTARRSFATNEFKAGTPSLTIMAITGHKTEKSFMKYIKVTPMEHAQILKLTWQKRAENKALELTA